MSKRVPCNECREHKRRCTGDNPCERCQRLKLKCVYTIRKSPKDEEYIQEVEMIEQIDQLRHHIAMMEAEIGQLSQTQPIVPTPHASPLTSSSSTVTGGSMSSPITLSSHDMALDLPLKAINNNNIIAQNDRGYSVSLLDQPRQLTTEQDDDETRQPLDWTLSVTNGNLSIHTKIHNHTELLSNLQKIVTTLEFQDQVPALFASATEPDPMSKMLHILMWKRYGKSRYKGIVKQMTIASRITRDLTIIPSNVVDISALMRRLIYEYTHCQHYMHLAIHCPTFMRLFVDCDRRDLSPAALATCAAICMRPCRHIIRIIDYNQCADYATYFAERAKEELSERFDEISLDVYLGYIFLALFKVHSSDIDESNRYGDFAERMRHVLEPMYQGKDQDPGQVALLHRASNVIAKVRTLSSLMMLSQQKQKGYKDVDGDLYASVHKKAHEHQFNLEVVEGDSPEEQRYIRAYQLMTVLRDEAHRVVHSFQSSNLMNFIGVFGHQLEMVMRLWYKETLDPDLRLSAPLFDDTMPENEFMDILERDCQASLVPIVTTMRIYGECFVMCRSHLPNTIVVNHRVKINYLPPEDAHDEEKQRKHQRRLDKLMRLREMIDFDGTEEEYLQTVFGALVLDTRDLRHSLLDITVRAAVCSLRIQKFLLRRQHDVCLFDPRIPLDALEVLKRMAKIYMYDDKQFALRVRSVIDDYISMLKDAVEMEPTYRRLDTKIQDFEAEVREELAPLNPWANVDQDLSEYVDI
ncbi:hypothetical protein K492DRAFT_208001 [Lichtheimia hyalospora FSU 10163]|nr:hypothetical protein K492DRAFT_208001 [Lichtheimia hyalospora FSU 10163]